jgi:hypothetical protein
MGLLDRIRPQPDWKHLDPKVRRASVRGLGDPSLLAEMARSDPDESVRAEAADALLGLALEADEEAVALASFEALDDPRQLLPIARSAAHEAVSRAALARLASPRALGSVVRHGRHPAVRLEALARLGDPAELGAVALKCPDKEIALAALERLEDRDLLTAVAQRARSKAAVHRARAILHGRGQPAAEAGAAGAQTDRRRQIQLCETVEALAKSEGYKHLGAHITAAQDAWTDLVPDVDEDLEGRFAAGCRAARERLAHNLAEHADRKRREEERAQFIARHIAPRLAMCEALEAAGGEESPRVLEDVGWEWDRLEPLDTDEGRALAQRFEAAGRACRDRHVAWRREREEARRASREAAERAEREKREHDNAARLQRLCERAERLAASEKLTLKRADPALRELKAALEELGPLPTRKEREATLKRLKAIHAALSPRVMELRESDEWKRWANTNVQEELCARAEALGEVADPTTAARRLLVLQERWKAASAASKDRSQELWLRFKNAADAVRARVDAHRADQEAKKLALCEQVEALAAISPARPADWASTAEAIKRLQMEWKTVGPTARPQEKVLWDRFRAACDAFFGRRKEDLTRRKEDWARNLEAKEALCVRAESLAESADWQATAAEIKRLQIEWKKVGPVRPNRSETVWHRFKGACDRFFERYKRRDEIDRAAHLAEREGLVRELEALIPAAGEAAASPPALETLRSARERWQKGPPLPSAQAAELGRRFQAALGRLLESVPGGVQGTELDAGANRSKMEELCARVERLLPAAGAPDEAALSPVARLATMWREALASNTIGGRAVDEGRWRAAAEDVAKAQAAWQRIGYVPDEIRRPLAERFERACRRVTELRDRSRPSAPAPRPVLARKRR